MPIDPDKLNELYQRAQCSTFECGDEAKERLDEWRVAIAEAWPDIYVALTRYVDLAARKARVPPEERSAHAQGERKR